MKAGEGQARENSTQEEDLANNRICIQDTEKGNGIHGGGSLQKRPGGGKGQNRLVKLHRGTQKAHPTMSSNLKQQY